MPQPPFIPPAGSPITPRPGAHREILAGLAAAAARKDWVPGGITAEGESDQALPAIPQIALFEITDNFTSGDPSDGTPNPPYGNWFHAPATKVEYYPAPAKWSTPANAGDETTIPLQVDVWHSAGYQLDSTDADRNMPDGLAAAYQFMPAAGPGQWVWCHFDEAAGIWVMLQPFEDIIRVQLAEDWYACDSATANILIANGDADEWLGFATGYAVTAYDPLGTIANDPLSLRDSSGNCYMPAGTCAILKRFADDNAWEPLRFMPGQCASGSGSAASGSGTPPCTPPAGATCSYVELEGAPGCWIEVWCTGSGGGSGGSGSASGSSGGSSAGSAGPAGSGSGAAADEYPYHGAASDTEANPGYVTSSPGSSPPGINLAYLDADDADHTAAVQAAAQYAGVAIAIYSAETEIWSGTTLGGGSVEGGDIRANDCLIFCNSAPPDLSSYTNLTVQFT